MTESQFPDQNLKELAARLGIPEKDLSLLKQALTHSSYSHEVGGESNERLEFLGDSVLSLVISEYIYKRFPRKTEGELSKWRASLVNSGTLAVIARRLNLGQYLLLGAGEEKSGGRDRDSLLADATEALLAVIYLCEGWDRVRAFISGLWEQLIEELAAEERLLDPKTMLQEVLHRKGESPQYNLVKVTGPDHNRRYTMAVYVQNKLIGTGMGRSKKEAAKNAAQKALKALKNLTPGNRG